MSNKLWKSKDKKMGEKWKTLLMNMPAHLYERLFPDVYNWVKKFTITTPKKEILKKKKEKNSSPVKMWQVCRRMKFRGAPPRLLNVGLPLWGPRIYEGHG